MTGRDFSTDIAVWVARSACIGYLFEWVSDRSKRTAGQSTVAPWLRMRFVFCLWRSLSLLLDGNRISSRHADILIVSSTDWGRSQNRLLPQVTPSCACCEATVSPRHRDHFRVRRTSTCIRLDCATRRITTDLANQIDATPVCRTDARKTDDVSHAVVTTEAR